MPELDLRMAFPLYRGDNERNAEFQTQNFMEAYRQNISRQDPIGPLKQQELRNRIAETALDIQNKQLETEARQIAKKDMLDTRASAAGAYNFMSTLNWEDPGSINQFYDFVSKLPNPSAAEPFVKEAEKRHDAALSYSSKVKAVEQRAAAAELRADYETQRNLLQSQKDQQLNELRTATQAERERHNKAIEEINLKKMELAGKRLGSVLGDASKTLSQIEYREFSELARSINQDFTLTPEQREAKLDALRERVEARLLSQRGEPAGPAKQAPPVSKTLIFKDGQFVPAQ